MLNTKVAAAGLASAFRATLRQGNRQSGSPRAQVVCPQLKGHRLLPRDSTNGSCHCSAATVTAELRRPGEGCAEGRVAASGHSTRGTGTAELPAPRSAPATRTGPRGGEDGINIVSIDCLNSDLMFSLSVSLGLFLSPSCQMSSRGRPSWKEIQPELVMERAVCVFCSWGPQPGPSQTSARETHQGLCYSHRVQREVARS